MFVVVVAVVVVFLFVPACITMHSGLCSPVLSGSVDEQRFLVGFFPVHRPFRVDGISFFVA